MRRFPEVLDHCTGFDWDAGNLDKNWERHGVTQGESEEVFFNRPVLVAPDPAHSQTEPRYAALGQTSGGRLLAVVFTIRGTLIRVISARDMSRRERRRYEQEEQREETDPTL
ncbi:BrnT family toxin [Nitrospira sp. Kam-Ns4a]